ncbi:MAG: DUF4870 domain-containing protein [Armatimonadota bacterium]
MTYATSQDERTWGMLCHLAAFAEFLGIPFGNIVGPLIVWMIYKDRYPFVDDQGRESLNFQISITIYFFALSVFTAISALLTIGLSLIVFIPVLLVVGLGQLILTIMAAVSANNGTPYRYPLTIRFF